MQEEIRQMIEAVAEGRVLYRDAASYLLSLGFTKIQMQPSVDLNQLLNATNESEFERKTPLSNKELKRAMRDVRREITVAKTKSSPAKWGSHIKAWWEKSKGNQPSHPKLSKKAKHSDDSELDITKTM